MDRHKNDLPRNSGIRPKVSTEASADNENKVRVSTIIKMFKYQNFHDHDRSYGKESRSGDRHSDSKSRSSLESLKNEEVKTWFEVSMEESSLVNACKTLKHLEAPVSHFYFREKFYSVLHKLV